jgi:large subunit ribosomal protein L5
MHAFIKQYTESAVPKLKEQKQYASAYLIPKIEKVVLNIGTGGLQGQGRTAEEAAANLVAISGQKPVVTKSRKAIAGFKIRDNVDVGMKVTLRGERMNDFLIKFAQIALPRTRDFRGLTPTSIAKDGSMHVGIKDSMIFPEANQDISHGIQVSIVTSPCSPEEARTLFEALGFVFQTSN